MLGDQLDGTLIDLVEQLRQPSLRFEGANRFPSLLHSTSLFNQLTAAKALFGLVAPTGGQAPCPFAYRILSPVWAIPAERVLRRRTFELMDARASLEEIVHKLVVEFPTRF